MNLLLWSLQAAVVILVAAAVMRIFRNAPPSIRLALWQMALVASLLLPVIRPWQTEVVSSAPILSHPSAVHVAPAAQGTPLWYLVPTEQWYLVILGAGILLKVVQMGLGLLRLRQYRRNAQPYGGNPSWNVEARLLTSDEITGPVTFGFFRPVILLPSGFGDLADALRETILCHETLHIRRKDWLFAVAEEAVQAILWFHPGIWWTVREIQLAREETVDRQVVDMMKSRETYVDALLAIAGSPLGFEIMAAPLFLRRRHLKRRVISIFSEGRMSKTKSVSAFMAGCTALVLSCWFVTGALPLKAAPQEVADGVGVSVDVGGARLMHRPGIMYTREAYVKGVEGTVVAQVKTDSTGNVVDAGITSGPDELRKTVLQSLLNWHFAGDSANSTRQITVTFMRPKGAPAPGGQVEQAKIVAGFATDAVRTDPATAGRITALEKPIKEIAVRGLPDTERDQLLAKLPLHVGDTWTAQSYAGFVAAVHNFDEHLTVGISGINGEITLEIRAPGFPSASLTPRAVTPMPEPNSITATPKGVRLDGSVAAGNLVSQTRPEYPPLAKAARVQGTVKFDALIGKDGTVQNLHLISGPPLLVQAALQAVQQWIYKPTLLNGQPVDVNTTIDVNFTLAQE